MATGALLVAAAGAAAGAAASASKKGPSLTTESSPNYAPRTKAEKLAYRENRSLIQSQTDVMTGSINNFNSIAAIQLYSAGLGMIPEYTDYSPQIEELQARRAELLAYQEGGSSSRNEAKRLKKERARVRRHLNRAKKKGDSEAVAALEAEKADLSEQIASAISNQSVKGTRKYVNAELSSINARLGQLKTASMQPTSFRKADPDELPADSPLSSHNPLNIAQAKRNDALIRALNGEEEPSSRLTRRFDEIERRERERLRRQIGPDFENSSQGIEALTRLRSARAEAEEEERQKIIRDYSALNINAQAARDTARASLLQAGAFLPQVGAQLGQALSDPIANTQNLLKIRQTDRGLTTSSGMLPERPGSATPYLEATSKFIGGGMAGGAAGGFYGVGGNLSSALASGGGGGAGG